jgi:transcriptional regulator with XRE-family HTH domain
MHREHPLRIWRKKFGVRLERLAEISGVSASHISMIERNQRTASLKNVIALSEATGRSVSVGSFAAHERQCGESAVIAHPDQTRRNPAARKAVRA